MCFIHTHLISKSYNAGMKITKVTIVTFIIAVSFGVLIPRPAAAQVMQDIIIAGRVTIDGKPAPGIRVKLACGASYYFYKLPTIRTSSTGHYGFTTSDYVCPLASDAKIYVGLASDAENTYRIIQGLGIRVEGLDLELHSKVVPEYNAVAGITALTAGGGLLLWFRRRTHHGEQKPMH